MLLQDLESSSLRDRRRLAHSRSQADPSEEEEEEEEGNVNLFRDGSRGTSQMMENSDNLSSENSSDIPQWLEQEKGC